ncbi:hypothetical protein D9613_012889 [Agrocybe pediades]|uniref:Uncharacterized protein n=1 Tax=Agrocybe pediades TaxID=84607 RepID=A0A8H4VMQ0_9AGAR|nr:hypothetical protein D9613_012889 [Agrocybe pediades]
MSSGADVLLWFMGIKDSRKIGGFTVNRQQVNELDEILCFFLNHCQHPLSTPHCRQPLSIDSEAAFLTNRNVVPHHSGRLALPFATLAGMHFITFRLTCSIIMCTDSKCSPSLLAIAICLKHTATPDVSDHLEALYLHYNIYPSAMEAHHHHTCCRKESPITFIHDNIITLCRPFLPRPCPVQVRAFASPKQHEFHANLYCRHCSTLPQPLTSLSAPAL